ncbi:hypothetical protein L1887_07616 [Cichorium endivia]|nr:hypothetical protein L1887_07616 [Cichorium endivia]
MHSKLKSRRFKTIEYHSSSPSCCCRNEASSVSANAVLSHSQFTRLKVEQNGVIFFMAICEYQRPGRSHRINHIQIVKFQRK